MIEAQIKFFDIKKCGYYLRGNNAPSLGSLDDTLSKLSSWAKDGREFVNTTSYETGPDIDLRNTYFCNSHHNEINGDHLLILWNEAANDNGVIYGMNPMDQPGETSMLTTGFGSEQTIPGFPSYFWFIPSKNVFATIRFGHSIQGKSNLDNYLNGFLENKSPYRVIDNDDVVIGYSQNGQPTDNSRKLYSKFYALGRKQEELEAELLSNLHKIRRIIKRETLQYTVEEDRKTLERVFSKLLHNSPVFQQARSITHELQFEPTEQQLRQIISNFSELNGSSSIRNAGFIYNDGKRIMLSGTSVAFPTEINVNRGDNQIISPNTLLGALTEQRQELLRVLDTPAFVTEAVISQ